MSRFNSKSGQSATIAATSTSQANEKPDLAQANSGSDRTVEVADETILATLLTGEDSCIAVTRTTYNERTFFHVRRWHRGGAQKTPTPGRGIALTEAELATVISGLIAARDHAWVRSLLAAHTGVAA